jgi:acyl-CoA synthetase (AMP-forming)/AMP-acid ligase II
VLTPQDDDIDFISLPVFVLCNLASGTTSVLPEGDLRHPGSLDPPPLLDQIVRHRVKRLLLPPVVCRRLADSGATLTDVRHIFTGGGPVFPDLVPGLRRLAPNARLTAVYGSSEAEPIAHLALDALTPDDFAAMDNGGGLLVGEPVPDIRLRFDDDEILVAGPHVVDAYLDPGDAVGIKETRDGVRWHRTGDAGRLDAAGRLWLYGRHRARCGGLYPFPLELAARRLPGVADAALACHRNRPVLVLARQPGETPRLPPAWLAQWSPELRTCEVDSLPKDARHNSKIDYARLEEIVDGGML